MTSTLIRRVLRNEARYPWERTPLGAVAWLLRPRHRMSNYASGMDNLWTAFERAIDPMPNTILSRRERRDMVRSHLNNAVTYLGWTVQP